MSRCRGSKNERRSANDLAPCHYQYPPPPATTETSSPPLSRRRHQQLKIKNQQQLYNRTSEDRVLLDQRQAHGQVLWWLSPLHSSEPRSHVLTRPVLVPETRCSNTRSTSTHTCPGCDEHGTWSVHTSCAASPSSSPSPSRETSSGQRETSRFSSRHAKSKRSLIFHLWYSLVILWMGLVTTTTAQTPAPSSSPPPSVGMVATPSLSSFPSELPTQPPTSTPEPTLQPTQTVSPSSPPSLSQPPSALPSSSPTKEPTFESPIIAEAKFRQKFTIGNGRIFAPEELLLFQGLYRSYTIHFAPPLDVTQGKIDTTCVVVSQVGLEGRRRMRRRGRERRLRYWEREGEDDYDDEPTTRFLQQFQFVEVDFIMTYTSIYTNVTPFPLLFRDYLNQLLDKVPVQMQLLGLDVTEVGIASRIIVTPQPTPAPSTSPQPSTSPTMRPTMSSAPSGIPSDVPSLAPTSVPTQPVTILPSQDTNSGSSNPNKTKKRRENIIIVVSIVVVGVVVMSGLLWYFTKRRKRLDNPTNPSSFHPTTTTNTTTTAAVTGILEKHETPPDDDDDDDGGWYADMSSSHSANHHLSNNNPAEPTSVLSGQGAALATDEQMRMMMLHRQNNNTMDGGGDHSVVSLGNLSMVDGGSIDDDDDDDDDTNGGAHNNNEADEFDQYKDPNLEKMRTDVQEKLPGFDGMMSQALTRALVDEDVAFVDPRELLWGGSELLIGAEVEASALGEVSDWLKRKEHASVEERRLFMQDMLNKMVASVHHGVLGPDDASRAIHECAALIGFPLATELPATTLIVSGMQKTVTPQDMVEAFEKFGDISEAAVASNQRGFGILRFKTKKSVDRAMTKFRREEIVVQDVAVQVKLLNPDSTTTTGGADTVDPALVGGASSPEST